jgi:hypothetical protein
LVGVIAFRSDTSLLYINAETGGAGGVQLRNANGVVLQLSGPRVGVELSAAVAGVTIRLK